MSFILDALKKSETERQRQSGPALFEVKVAPPRVRFPVWAVVVGALLGINLLVLLWVLLRRDEPTPRADTPAAASSSAMVPGANPVPPGSYTGVPPPMPPGLEEPTDQAPVSLGAARGVVGDPADNQAGAAPRYASGTRYSNGGTPAAPAPNPRDYAPAVMPGTPEANAASTERAAARRAAAIVAEQVREQSQATAPAASRSGSSTSPTSGLPTRDELVNSGRAQIPEVEISLHAYDPSPSKRFAFINGKRAREGDTVANGVVLESITRDGAIFNASGQRFALRVQ